MQRPILSCLYGELIINNQNGGQGLIAGPGDKILEGMHNCCYIDFTIFLLPLDRPLSISIFFPPSCDLQSTKVAREWRKNEKRNTWATEPWAGPTGKAGLGH